MTSTDVALREAVEGTVAQFRDPDYEQQIALAVPENISPRKLLRVAATAVLDNPKLAAPELRPTLLQATLKCGADGLLPDGNEAAFVIFGGREPKVAYMPMVGGLRKIAAEYGWSIYTAVIHENDEIDPTFERRPVRPRLGTDRGPIVGAYADARHRDGRREFEVMDVAEIKKVQATSRAKDSGPWKEWWDRMAEKTVARRLFKKLPLDPNHREHIDRVLAATDLDTGERVELLYGKASSLAAGDERTPAMAPMPTPSASGRESSGSGTAGPETPDVIDLEAEEIPFEGEEPPPLPEEPEVEPTFTSGRYSGKTLEQVLASGKDGLSYVRWAYKSWKSEPLRSALDRFAEAHPEIKG